MELARNIDALCDTRVLVFGSLPPHGRDLDLLTRDEKDARELKAALSSQGFIARGSSLVRFSNGSIEGVDVVPAPEWGLPDGEVQALFESAGPVLDLARIVQPSPHHSLLILARRFVRTRRALADKHRDRIAVALKEDPAAWENAASLAQTWGATKSLELLRLAFLQQHEPAKRELIAALTDEYSARGRSGARLHAVRRALKRPSGAVVALSGVDGSGKSTQAEALRDALERAGYEAAIEWTKIARNPSLGHISAPVDFLLRRPGRRNKDEGPTRDARPHAKRLREQSSLVTHGWTLVVAFTNASTHRKATRAHLKQGRVVICDRYVLDSAAHLRYRYGPQRRFRLQRAIVRWLSPKPLQQFLLRVPAEVALARKAEQYDLEQLTNLARLYDEEREALGVTAVDATESPEKLSARLAQEVWERLAE